MIPAIKQLASEYESAILGRYRAINANYRWSTDRLDLLRQEFLKIPTKLGEQLSTVVVVGSYGRREASAESDFDRIVITASELGDTLAFESEFDQFIDPLLTKLNLAKPNPKGIFMRPIAKAKIISIAGDSRETYADLSRRVLMMLESKYVLSEKNYNNVRLSILEKYAEDVVRQFNKNFVFLLNDTIRYFRTICVNYQYTKGGTEWGKWPLRNIKLRHSRVIMYFSLVAALGALSRYDKNDKLDVLLELIELEPLRRLFVAYSFSQDDGFFRVAQYYNVFLTYLNSPDVRSQLNGLEYEARYGSDHFAVLKANSDGLSAELWRFFEAQKGKWNERFFEYMII